MRTPFYGKDESNLTAYLAEIKRYPRLTRDEEVMLSRRIQLNGDTLAIERLIECNLRLVVSIAKRIPSRHVSLDDRIQAGNYGLCRAAREYDATRHPSAAFSTFAGLLIRQEIAGEIGESDIVSIPEAVYHTRKKVWKFQDTFFAGHDREPSPQEIMTALGLSKNQYEAARAAVYHMDSLDAAISFGEDGDEQHSYGDTLSDPNMDVESEALTNVQISEIMALVDDVCTQRERLVLSLRYGINQRRTYLLEEIGKRLGLARETIRQDELQALAKLRAAYESGKRPSGLRQILLWGSMIEDAA